MGASHPRQAARPPRRAGRRPRPRIHQKGTTRLEADIRDTGAPHDLSDPKRKQRDRAHHRQRKVEAGRQSSPLCEVELELKRGESAELFKLARMLAEEVPVQLAVKSKAEHGYALIAGRPAEG